MVLINCALFVDLVNLCLPKRVFIVSFEIQFNIFVFIHSAKKTHSFANEKMLSQLLSMQIA